MTPDYDLAIIGGGINGAGIARDAALRGLSVILFEKDDFARGASGQNGRMIHGGLKYLATLDIGLVREALQERRTLKRIAPHLVRPVDLTMPIRKGGHGKMTMAAGLLLFDILNGFRDPRSRMISAAETLRTCGGLSEKGLVGAAVIHDAWAEYSERLTIENLVDAGDHTAEILNRARVTGLAATDDGRAVRVTFAREGSPARTVSAAVVVNATGAWADELLADATGSNQRLLRASKGTILVVDGLVNAPDRPVFFETVSDRRPVLISPWNGMHLVGTTDIVVEIPVDSVCAEHSEVDYLLDEINRSFPRLALRHENIRYLYTGVRPLPFSTGTSAKVSRHHIVKRHPEFSDRLITVIGGKLATYRRIAEDVLKAADGKFDRPLARSQTATRPLPGALDLSEQKRLEDRAITLGLSDQSITHLVKVYGARGAGILDLIDTAPKLAEVVDDESGATAAEIHFVIQKEWARDLADILVRRTMIGRNRFAGANAIAAVVRVLNDIGWSAEMIDKGITDFDSFLSKSKSLIASGKKRECDGAVRTS